MSEKISIICTYRGNRFHNTDTGFIIGNFTGPDGEKVAGLGVMSNPNQGCDYELTGTWHDDPQWGKQFKFSRFMTIQPIDEVGIFKYIVRTCKFVGVAAGNAILAKHGTDTLEIMKRDPETLALIPGITLDRANEISRTLLQNEAVERVTVELESLLDVKGMHKNTPQKLIQIYKHNAAEKIRENPYVLTEISGLGFHIADRVALKNKYPIGHINRKTAAAVHVLKEKTKDGDIWIVRAELIDGMQSLIQVKGLLDGIDALIDEGVFVEHLCDLTGLTYVAIRSHHENETYIAEKIIKLMRA